MKKKLLISFILCPFLAYGNSNENKVIKSSVQNFNDLKTYVDNNTKNDNLENTLFVFDDDDTLTMIPCNKDNCQYIGGTAWWIWQGSLKNTSSSYKVKNLDNVASLLLDLSKMNYTDKNIPNVLSYFKNKGGTLIVETARPSSLISATEKQFKNLKVNDISLFDFFNENALKPILNNQYNNLNKINASSSLISPYYPCKDSSKIKVVYKNGVIFTGGINKGIVLKCFLKNFDKKIDNIFFLDDIDKNVKDVYEAFKNDKNNNYNVHSLHYLKMQEHKKKFLESKELQDIAKHKVEKLQNVINKIISKPEIN